MAGPYHYYLGPWQWRTVVDEDGGESSFWSPPESAVGCVDLRSMADQALAGVLGDKPIGFFACLDAQPSEYVSLGEGDLREISVTTLMRDAWESLAGYLPDGATLLDLLWDQLVGGSVPDGSLPTRPLIPTVAGNLELWLGGHSRVKAERFRWGVHPHASRVQDVIRADFRAAHGRNPLHAQKVLGGLLQKYRLPDAEWRQFVPQDLQRDVPGPHKPDTDLGDTFSRGDDTDLNAADTGKTLNGAAGTWQWTEVLGDSQIVSNKLNSATGSVNNDLIRAEQDLSGSDHYCEIDRPSASGNSAQNSGAAARFATAATTAYVATQHGGSTTPSVETVLRLRKVVEGTYTDLGAGPTCPQVATKRLECNGSTIKSFSAGVEIESITDTAITSGTRCGSHALAGTGTNAGDRDNFYSEDLAAGGGTLPMRTLMGVGV
jgi:hypothetical protein